MSAASYDLIGGIVFTRGSVGTAFRYPDAYELFAIDPTCCFGNPDLKPETSTNFNGSIGGRVTAGETSVKLEAITFFRQRGGSDCRHRRRVRRDDHHGEQPEPGQGVRRVVRRLVGALTSAFSASLAYTYTKSQQNQLAGGYDAILGLPSNQFEAGFDLHPTTMPFGVGVSVNSIGEITDSVSGIGTVPSGDYTIVDLSGRFFFDGARRHRINVRMENLLDEQDSTTFRRNFTDGGTPFLANYLGTPGTFHVSYTFAY